MSSAARRRACTLPWLVYFQHGKTDRQRKDLERPLDKARARELVSGHLDMYLPEAEEVLSDATELSPEVRHREMRTPSPSPRA